MKCHVMKEKQSHLQPTTTTTKRNQNRLREEETMTLQSTVLYLSIQREVAIIYANSETATFTRGDNDMCYFMILVYEVFGSPSAIEIFIYSTVQCQETANVQMNERTKHSRAHAAPREQLSAAAARVVN